MLAFTTALLTATIALVGKIGFDSWARYRERQGIAASLAGEIQMYLHFAGKPGLVTILRGLAGANREERLRGLMVFGELPKGHPVFDRVADKIGLISVDVAFELSKIYNVVTSMRLMISQFSSDRFITLSDEQQAEMITPVADGIETYLIPAGALVVRLQQISHQPFRCYLCKCGAEKI